MVVLNYDFDIRLEKELATFSHCDPEIIKAKEKKAAVAKVTNFLNEFELSCSLARYNSYRMPRIDGLIIYLQFSHFVSRCDTWPLLSRNAIFHSCFYTTHTLFFSLLAEMWHGTSSSWAPVWNPTWFGLLTINDCHKWHSVCIFFYNWHVVLKMSCHR